MKDNLSAYSSNDYDSRVSSVLPYYSEFHNQVLDLAESLDLKKSIGLIPVAEREVLL